MKSDRHNKNNNNPELPADLTEEDQKLLEEAFQRLKKAKENLNNSHTIPADMTLPLLTLRDIVVYPGMTIPITLESKEDISLARDAEKNSTSIAVVTIKNQQAKRIGIKQLYETGTLAHVMKIVELPDGGTSALLQTRNTLHIDSIEGRKPYLTAKVSMTTETFPEDDDREMAVIIESIFSTYHKILNLIGDDEAVPVRHAFEDLDHPLSKMHFISVNSPLDLAEKQSLLDTSDIKQRAEKLAQYLSTALQLMEIKAEVAKKTSQKLSQQQREHFLRSQINVMQDELGSGSIEDEEMDELEKRAAKKNWNKEVRAHFDKEMRKLERFNASSPEYGIQYGYLETMLNLPWNVYSEDDFSIDNVQASLDADHYGLEKVKERILEQVAVMKLRGDMRAPILCLYGPPGVGKTSLGKSIADALGRQYARVALGGVHDEAEIRGHRKTYVGAMPGRIIAALQKVGTSNPVFVLDEIDKIGRDMKGDPSTALLEVLDPEQNKKFHDNYLDIDYDLSKVMFIATANNLETVSRPLRDRMEIIEIPGYVSDEKIAIARCHLVPKILQEHGLDTDRVAFPDETLQYIIDRYTRESGVRTLEKKLSKIIRKIAVRIAKDDDPGHDISISDARSYLGREDVDPDMYEDNSFAGVVTGLAWTAVGGEILFVETSLSKGKGEKLTLTGNLGDVMKESAMLALQYLKAHAPQVGIPEDVFGKYDIHLHVPEGAIPKDGPSAGITMATALASAYTRRRVRPRLAMTGEITLRGKVLPVGGIKEKILAAKRAGINTVILCEKNRKDIEEIKESYLEGMQFHYVNTIAEVLNLALTDEIDNSLPER